SSPLSIISSVLASAFYISLLSPLLFSFFFFNDTPTTEIYTLSLRRSSDLGLPLPVFLIAPRRCEFPGTSDAPSRSVGGVLDLDRSEEHTSELQSRVDLVCRLLLEKKKRHECNNSTK